MENINELEKKLGLRENANHSIWHKATVYDNAAKQFSKEGDNEKAKEYWLEAANNYMAELDNEKGCITFKAADYYFAGRSYLDAGNYEKAKECFSEGKKICEKVISAWSFNMSTVADYAAWNSPSALYRAHDYMDWINKGSRKLFVRKLTDNMKNVLKELISKK